MAVTGIHAACAGVVIDGWACILLAERTPMMVEDWMAFVFLSAIWLGLLLTVLLLLRMTSSLLRQRMA
jgi:hypothetical protein